MCPPEPPGCKAPTATSSCSIWDCPTWTASTSAAASARSPRCRSSCSPHGVRRPWQGPEAAPEPGRTAPQSSPTGGLVVDRRTREVWIGERPIILTPKEFDLLALLAEDPGAVYSRQEILDRVWDLHFHGPTKTLDVHVATLRRKLGDPAWIQTLRGVGLRLAVRTRSDTNHPESQPR